jgi:adenylate cyclase
VCTQILRNSFFSDDASPDNACVIHVTTPSTTPIHQTFLPLAILFADIAGSTRLYESLGDAAARKIVSKALRILMRIIQENDGTVVKTIGDEIMCTFAHPSLAARAAIAMHKTLRKAVAAREIDVPKLAVRVGFHFGEVIREKGDVFGDAVNSAARIVAQAKSHQVLTSRSTVNVLDEDLRDSARFVDQVAVKGKIEAIDLFELVWDYENVTLVEAVAPDFTREGRPLTLRFHDATTLFDSSRLTLTIGRGAESDIVLNDVLASRLHGRIERRRDRFFYVDLSINGTYVQLAGERELYVRRDETALNKSGVISPGRPTKGNAEHSIFFSCDGE